MVRRPSPHDPFCLGTRAAGLAVAWLGARHGGLGWIIAMVGAWSLLRVPRRRLLLELAALALLAAALWPEGGLAVAASGAALLIGLAAPESRALPLNALDRFFVAQDYPGTPMNSHHFVDTRAPIDRAALERALAALMAEVPMLRSFVREAVLGVERFVARKPWISAASLISWSDEPLEARDSAMLDAHIDLARSPPFRVIHAPRVEGGFRLCLTVHHSAVDGEGGLLLLGWLITRYNEAREGRPPSPLALPPDGRRFRILLGRKGLPWLVRAIRRHVRPFGKVGVVRAHLLDDERPQPTHSRHQMETVSPSSWEALKSAAASLGVTRNDLLVAAALRAADRLRSARGNPDRPYRILLPTNLRKELGMPATLGNYVGTVKLEVTPDEVRATSLPQVVSTKVREGRSLDESIETPVHLGVISAIMPPKLLRAALRRLDADPHSFFFSFLWSHMRSPPELPLPVGADTLRILVRGSLARRPGCGLAVTQSVGAVNVVFEYLHPIVSDATARAILQGFLAELEGLGLGKGTSETPV
ncbi:MAG: hypothetical protein HY698_01820 [Deltaproteobacteria bacterium]|nr:hypothetical protein [Deltaproteobacteria bacterium]